VQAHKNETEITTLLYTNGNQITVTKIK